MHRGEELARNPISRAHDFVQIKTAQVHRPGGHLHNCLVHVKGVGQGRLSGYNSVETLTWLGGVPSGKKYYVSSTDLIRPTNKTREEELMAQVSQLRRQNTVLKKKVEVCKDWRNKSKDWGAQADQWRYLARVYERAARSLHPDHFRSSQVNQDVEMKDAQPPQACARASAAANLV